jgi:FMN-dependent NADH-azoreductase
VIVASQGLAYDEEPQREMDHCVPVLRIILGDALGMAITVIYTRYTLADRIPQLADMVGRAQAEHDAALRKAADLAAKFG